LARGRDGNVPRQSRSGTGMEADPAGGRSQTCHALQIDISDASYDDKTGADSRLAPRTSAQALQDAKEAADARGSVRWWLRGTCGASGAATGEKAQNRDLQETCIFALVQADGRTRRLVRKMGSDDRDREVYQGPPDFDDTASWQSWRSLASHGSLRLSRSASEASCHSTTSGAAMQELLAGSDDHYFASIAAGRDWATCIFAEHRCESGKLGKSSAKRMVKPLVQSSPTLCVGGERIDSNGSWTSFALDGDPSPLPSPMTSPNSKKNGVCFGRTLSQASCISSTSAVAMNELLINSDDGVSSPVSGSVLAKPRKTPKMVKPLVPPAPCKRLDSEEDAEAKSRPRFASEPHNELMDIVPQEESS